MKSARRTAIPSEAQAKLITYRISEGGENVKCVI